MCCQSGNLRPDHDAVAVGSALHALVVGVVGEADEVGVEIFEEAEDGVDVFVGVGAAACERGFGVHVGALQEDGLAVEQDAGAIDADVAEADVVGECVFAGGELDLVELRTISGDQRMSLRGFDVEGRAAVCVGAERWC